MQQIYFKEFELINKDNLGCFVIVDCADPEEGVRVFRMIGPVSE